MGMKAQRKPRVELEISLNIRPVGMDRYFRAEILNLSEGGFRFKEEEPGLMEALEGGGTVEFLTSIDFYGIRGKGRVVWISQKEETAGICFLELDEKSEKLLQEFLRICL